MLGGWLQALILDYDGTIVDTESMVLHAWERAWASVGAVLRTEDWLACVGTRGGFDPIARLEERLGHRVDRDAVAGIAAEEETRGRDLLEPRPGIVDWIEQARAAGLPVAVATSSDHSWVEAGLLGLGLADRIDAIRAYDDVDQRAKPDPAVYVAACAAIGIQPSACLAVEDSANGLAAAKTAGLRIVVTPNPVTASMDLTAADLRLASLADAGLAAVAEQLAVSRTR